MILDDDGRVNRFERGDVVWGVDPFDRAVAGSDGARTTGGSDGGTPRPWLVLSTDVVPFHPEQYRCVSFTSRAWHEESVPIPSSGWTVGGAPATASVMPWSVAAIKHEYLDHEADTRIRLDVEDGDALPHGFQGRLSLRFVDEVTRRLVGYFDGTIGS